MLFPGWVYDVTDDYDIPYYAMGTVMMLGGAIVLIIPCLMSRDQHVTELSRKSGELETGNHDEDDDVFTEHPNEDGSSNSLEMVTCQGRMRTISASSHLSART